MMTKPPATTSPTVSDVFGATRPVHMVAKVVVVGAGASGLQCARQLILEDGLDPDDIVLLEARSRIGGRIHTTHHAIPHETNNNGAQTTTTKQSPLTTTTTTTTNGGDDGEFYNGATTTWIPIDEGAAWVHGLEPLPASAAGGVFPYNPDAKDDTHLLTNPMLDYLTPDQIRPRARGNPWVRPYYALQQTNNMSLFLQQQQQQQPSSPEPQPGSHNQNGKKKNDSPTNPVPFTKKKVINAAIRKHNRILREIEKEVDQAYADGQGMELVHANLGDALSKWNEHSFVAADDHDDVRRLTSFYQFLTTNWYGLSPWEVCLAHYASAGDDSDDDRSDEDDDDPLYDDLEFESDGDFGGAHCTVRGGMSQIIDALCRLPNEEASATTPTAVDGSRDCMAPPSNINSTNLLTIQDERKEPLETTPRTISSLKDLVQTNQTVVRIDRITPDHEENNASDIPQEQSGETKVSSLDSSTPSTGVRLMTQSGEWLEAEACVVTIPMGCLRKTHTHLFATTPLSQGKQQAIELATMAHYKKVLLTFDQIFWPREPTFLGLVLDPNDCSSSSSSTTTTTRVRKASHPGMVTESASPLGNHLLIDNLWAKDGLACFEAVLIGDAARWGMHKSDEVIKDAVLEFIEKAMNLAGDTNGAQNGCRVDVRKSCTRCHITRWEEDEYSLGAYAAMSVDVLPRHLEALQEPEWDGRLVFAGDAMVPEFEGSVFAALFSGREAANKIRKVVKVDGGDKKQTRQS